MTILSTDLVKQFVESTHDETETKGPSRFYGTASVRQDGIYVILDGSTIPTPVSMATDAQTGDRVLVEIVNHQARVIQNINKSNSDIVAGRIEHDETGVFQELRVGKEYVNTLIASDITADSIVADRAKITSLETDKADISSLTAIEASISDLQAEDAAINTLISNKADISALNAATADITQLQSDYAEINELVAGKADVGSLTAIEANISDLQAADATITGELNAVKANIESLDSEFVQIDFANIDNAWFQNFYAKSGIIKDLVIGDTSVTGHLVGVTITGDQIEANTIKADRLVVLGDDGLYYKLNFEGGTFAEGEVVPQDSLHGSIITTNSITAEKIQVDDLIAFDATIGGFNIGENSLYSGVKSSIDNTTRGIYMDNQGQIYFGDSNNYLKYYKFADNDWRLEVAAKNIIFGASGSNIEDTINEIKEEVTSSHSDINDLETGVDLLNETVFGVQTFEHILDGVTIPAHKREDGTYYYILNDEEVTVAEADLVHDSYGELKSYQDGGVYEDLEIITGNIETIDTKVNGFDARETAIYDSIRENSLIARNYARFNGQSLIITNESEKKNVDDLDNYLQMNSDSILIYSNKDPAVAIGVIEDTSGNKSGYMKMKGTSLFIAQESRLSTIRLRSAEKIGKLALVAGSDGHVSLREVLD